VGLHGAPDVFVLATWKATGNSTMPCRALELVAARAGDPMAPIQANVAAKNSQRPAGRLIALSGVVAGSSS
jgi:hypothetical protein